MTAPRSDNPVARLGEFLRYLACSALALGVDAGLFALCTRQGVFYPVAACIGFLAGLAVAYLLSVRWAFRERAVRDAATEFAIFAAIGLAGLLLTELLLWVQIGVIGLPALAAKAGAAGLVFLFNFGARKALLFTRRGAIARSVA
jgi:putative flippase GtrA